MSRSDGRAAEKTIGGGRTARVGCPRRLQAGWRYCRGEQLAGTTSRETEAGDTPTRSLGE